MTNSESIHQFGANAYGKPATALNILRETVMGRELFDHAFTTYGQRWWFKRPEPADFFRTMEDASGVDLDWFWRGWFYTTDHVDISVENVRHFVIDTRNPDIEKERDREEDAERPLTKSDERNDGVRMRVDDFPELEDFYNHYDEFDVVPKDRREYEEALEELEDSQRELLGYEANFYAIDLENVGGLVMPVILQLHFEDGSTEERRIPAEIWRRNNLRVSSLVMTEKTLERVVLDPHWETADGNVENNHWPRKIIRSRFDLYDGERKRPNPMRDAKEEAERGDEMEPEAVEADGDDS